MEQTLALSLSHATEIGAIEAARAAGYGDKNGADQAAVTAIRDSFNKIDFSGKIVIGEGERDEAPMLYIGEKVGTGKGKEVDIAIDPLENTNATATLGPRAIAVLAASEKGGLFHAPDMYMEKLIVPPRAAGKVNLDDPVKTTLKTLATVLKRDVDDLTITILDRSRNEETIAKVREAGARVKLIMDGDLFPGVATCMRGTGVHAVMGIGAAPEGVMTAAALRCIKGEMQARFWPKNKGEEMGFCMKNTPDSEIHEQNILLFVFVHELAHCMTKTYGHPPIFWRNMSFLLEQAENVKLLENKNYYRTPEYYCSMKVSHNPLYI